MIRHPALLFIALAGAVAFVHGARRVPGLRAAFRFLPVPFWCYFLPMLASTIGLFPTESPLYAVFSRYLLPLCLAMLLVQADLKSLSGLGRPAMAAMGAAATGIVLGAVASFALLHRWLPPESWRAVGTLSGSWTGGSANMLALKEALSTPDALLAPVVVVDTFFAYGWMAFLIFLSGYQHRFDRWVGAREDLQVPAAAGSSAGPETPASSLGAAGVCLALALFSIVIGDRLPELGKAVSRATWAVLLVTTLSLLVSLGGRFAGRPRAEGWGMLLLYLLLASLGARARLTAILEAPLFLALGAVWLLVHGAVLLAAGRAFRLPAFLLATASQACVGGVVSTPVVAAVYRPAMSAVGLLLAVAGNVAGTYLGFVTAHLCRWAAR